MDFAPETWRQSFVDVVFQKFQEGEIEEETKETLKSVEEEVKEALEQDLSYYSIRQVVINNTVLNVSIPKKHLKEAKKNHPYLKKFMSIPCIKASMHAFEECGVCTNLDHFQTVRTIQTGWFSKNRRRVTNYSYSIGKDERRSTNENTMVHIQIMKNFAEAVANILPTVRDVLIGAGIGALFGFINPWLALLGLLFGYITYSIGESIKDWELEGIKSELPNPVLIINDRNAQMYNPQTEEYDASDERAERDPAYDPDAVPS